MRDAPEQIVEQREALRIAVADDVLGETHVAGRYAERGRALRRRLATQQVARAGAPRHIRRRHGGADQGARGVAKLLERILAAQIDAIHRSPRNLVHPNSVSCSAGGASAARRRDEAWSAVGW